MADEMLEPEELMALLAQEEKMEEDNEEDLEALREMEAEAVANQEDRVRKALFSGCEEGKGARLPVTKRQRDPCDVSDPLIDLPEDDDDPKTMTMKSPSPKRQRHISTSPSSGPVTSPSAYVAKMLKRARARKIFSRVPDGEFVAVTTDEGKRFYLCVRDHPALETSEGKRKKEAHFCGMPYAKLYEQALVEQEKMISKADSLLVRPMPEQSNYAQPQGTSQVSASELWAEKYRPKSFIDLLSDDGTNRVLLTWLKLWDKAVFGRQNKKFRSALPSNEGKENVAPIAVRSHLPDVIQELDANGLPQQRLALLHGPPGLGKTTLAHVIAVHAGYSVVEMNASDDRSVNAFKVALEAATQMRSVNAKDQRPNCLIVDEIDGAPAQTINFLVGLITGTGKKGKTKKGPAVQRPVICICNDQYAPALRPLRQHCLSVPFPPTLSARLSQRLLEIARRERLRTDLGALSALCDKTDNDIRSCLSTLQFFKIRGSELKASDVQKTNVGRKDAQKGLFTVWRELFTVPRFTNKTSSQPNTAIISQRFDNVLYSVYSCGEYEKLMNGVFENYAEMKFKDSQFFKLNKGLEWFSFFDEVACQIAHTQRYTLMGYQPFTFVAAHLFFASLQRPKLSYPHTGAEKRTQLTRAKNLVMALISEMATSARAGISIDTLIFDTLPLLLEIIQPNLRAVNLQLYSAREKEELHQLVQTMLSYNLTYVQERAPSGQYVYRLDPHLDDVVRFREESDPSEATRELPYAIKQIVAREVDMEKMRNESVSEPTKRVQERAKPSNSNNDQKGTVTTTTRTTTTTTTTITRTPSHLQRLETKKVDVTYTSPVDFFGRKIEVKKCERARSEEDKLKAEILSSDVWFRFKEGYNNAVRKNVKIKDLA